MLTQRLGSATQKDPAFIDALIHEILAHPGSCDEVWLATDYGFPALDVHRQTAETLAEVAEKFRKIGVRVSLQLSNSIGHGQYMESEDCSGLVYDGSPIEKMVGHDGTVANYCFCWRGKNFREYVLTELKAYLTAIQPHTLWVDDDLRASNHAPVAYGCFCDDCIAAFNEKYGSAFTREELVHEINFGELQWREKHIEFIRESLYDFTYAMGEVVRECAPGCAMGFQYCAHGGYTGFGYDFIFDAMKNATGKNPASRPGGGCYNDHNPSAFIGKAELIAYQNYMLPDYVKDKRPEIENLPDIVYGKSIGGTCFETSFYLASGNNAMSYAMLMNDYEPMEWHGEMLEAFTEHRPYWEKLCEVNNRSYQTGVKVVLPHEGYLANCNREFQYSAENYNCALPLRFVNIPVAITRHDCDVYLLNAENARRLTDREINELLKKPVLTDGEAITVLNERGYVVGATAKPIATSILHEYFTDHPANGNLTGKSWRGCWGRNSDWEIFGENLEVLSHYRPTNGTTLDHKAIASAIFTTREGAKWIALSDLWGRGISTDKRNQYLNAMAYISGKRFAGELVTPIQAVVHPRVNADGKTVAMSITNCTVGDSGELSVIIRNPAGTCFTFMGQCQPEISLTPEKIGENEYLVKVPNIRGWAVCTIFID